ncbi:MAG: peptidoglycan DD-metalloendopeptidase family protein [Patescibacteria group bacterium]
MYSEETLNQPPGFLISNPQQPSRSTANVANGNAYRAIAVLIAAGLTLSLIALLIPRAAGAFWPFRGAQAQVSDTLTHDASMELLAAAVNSDPNPNKGGGDLALSGDSALLAKMGPEGAISPKQAAKTAANGGGQISSYTVKEGDSLSEIAERFGVTVNTILWANDIKSANLVKPGDDLLILPVSGLQYTVRAGDTISGIAKKYGADPEEVALFNGLESSADLKAGSDIIVPGGALPTTKAKVATKSSTAAKSSGAAASRSLPAISGYFGNPVPGGKISQGVHGYNGIDVAAPSGTPIYAAAAGTIVVAKNNDGYNGGYGNYIVISHDNGTQTLYAHMTRTAVSGGSVGKGELIGYVGNTGRSTGNHLHFEVRGAKNPLAN